MQNNPIKHMIFIHTYLHVHLILLLVCSTLHERNCQTLLYKFSSLEAATGTNPKAQSGDETNEFVEATAR